MDKMDSAASGSEIIEHPADMGLNAWAQSLPELFAQSALALTSVLVDMNSISTKLSKTIELSAANKEDLLYKWLSEILYLYDGEKKLFRHFDIGITAGNKEFNLRAILHGEKYNKGRHQIRTYVKAITYHQLAIKPCKNGFEATIFLDI